MLPGAANLTYEARCVNVFKVSRFTAAVAKPAGLAGARGCAVGGHDWRIELHLKVSNPNLFPAGADWIMLRVHLTSQGSPHGVAARISWRLIDPGSPVNSPEKTTTSSVFYENYPQDIFLVTRSELESSRRRRSRDEDCVLLQCNLTVVLDPNDVTVVTAKAPKLSLTVPSPDLHRQLGELLRSEKGADVTFLVVSECVPAHRSVLAARSPVFMAELLGDMKEKDAAARVVVDDMEAEVFRTLLRFVYTDTVPELEEEEGEEQVTLMAQHLLEAADRYGLERLKRICVQKVAMGISLDTVATTLALAEQHGCSELKSRCMRFILATPENYRAVVATEGYKHLEASCPSVVDELLMLKVKGHK